MCPFYCPFRVEWSFIRLKRFLDVQRDSQSRYLFLFLFLRDSKYSTLLLLSLL